MTAPRVLAPPLMPSARSGWSTLFEVRRRLGRGWTVIGGQMAQLHSWERGRGDPRPTTDLDAGLGYREVPGIGVVLTGLLRDLGYRAGTISPDGPQVRWVREGSEIDVLIPRGSGRSRYDVGGRRLMESHGIQQALDRTEEIELVLHTGESGLLPRPRLFGSLIAQCAALSNTAGTPDRHLYDIGVMAEMLEPGDLARENITRRDRVHLGRALDRWEQGRGAWRDLYPRALPALEQVLNS
ncbi:hypothetical protein [Rothia kristinae]|uniref:hypothetical protein n=1 Tax=Rothia kristinae TaxID=37923 RepID=UPI00073711C2|nr:hypothetical protein [Rothia kristinae]TDP51437.1 hypothetical protein DEU33_2105 [Kocuria sp. AG109]KTR34624.1 hypothetical protein RSA5_09665 [Rothia kristinae]KTR60300.1 hypothetical protein SA11R_01385 [Rothia kristinae]KTR67476.1 hypothetical protein SA12R_06055 [Rothia kristinae]KTR67666.1 hypothetical protein SA15R_08645 [Rothia kristinae]